MMNHITKLSQKKKILTESIEQKRKSAKLSKIRIPTEPEIIYLVFTNEVSET